MVDRQARLALLIGQSVVVDGQMMARRFAFRGGIICAGLVAFRSKDKRKSVGVIVENGFFHLTH